MVHIQEFEYQTLFDQELNKFQALIKKIEATYDPQEKLIEQIKVRIQISAL